MKRRMFIAGINLVLGLSAIAQGEKPPALAPPTPSSGGLTPVPRQQRANPATGFYFGGGTSSAQSIYSAGAGPIASPLSGVPPLVVRFSGSDDEGTATLEEDLNIMTRLIERSLQHGIGEDASDERMGIKMLYTESGRSVRSLYLDGFGALFMIKVGFPVFAPSAPEPREPQPASDSEWDKAKRDLYGESVRAAEMALLVGESQFDSDQVQELKKVLLLTLKNGANIHSLKPDDTIAITVFGRPFAAAPIKKSRSKKDVSNNFQANSPAPRPEPAATRKPGQEVAQEDQKNKANAVVRETVVRRSSNQGTVLTLRVKKSDVDAFAADKLDFEGFQKRAEQNSYSGNGYGISSINSWSRNGSSSGAIAP